MDVPVMNEQEKHTFNSSVWTLDVDKKSCRERWMIGTIGEREENPCQLRDLIIMKELHETT